MKKKEKKTEDLSATIRRVAMEPAQWLTLSSPVETTSLSDTYVQYRDPISGKLYTTVGKDTSGFMSSMSPRKLMEMGYPIEGFGGIHIPPGTGEAFVGGDRYKGERIPRRLGNRKRGG